MFRRAGLDAWKTKRKAFAYADNLNTIPSFWTGECDLLRHVYSDALGTSNVDSSNCEI